MTISELVMWCDEHDVEEDTELCFDRGIDLVEQVSHAVYNGNEIVLYPKGFEEEAKDEAVL